MFTRLTGTFASAVAAGLALSLGLTGCTSPPQPSTSSFTDPALRGTWELLGGTDDFGKLDVSRTYMTFTIGTASSVVSPCGSERARIRGGIGAVWVKTASIGSGRCFDSRQVALDTRFVRALNHAKLATLRSGALVLDSPDSRLRFRQAKPSPIDSVIGRSWQLFKIDTSFGSEHRLEPFEGYATVTVTSRQSLVVDTGCSHIVETFRPQGTDFQARGSDGSSKKCAEAEQALDDTLARVFYDGYFTISVTSKQMIVATSSNSFSLYFQQFG
jgi:hypothetical protein